MLTLHPFVWGWFFGSICEVFRSRVDLPWWSAICIGLGIGFFAAWMWPQDQPETDE